MPFVEVLKEKNYVSSDEVFEEADFRDRFGNKALKWKAPESYIPFFALKSAMEDPEVCVGDIHLNDGYIYLLDNRHGMWKQ